MRNGAESSRWIIEPVLAEDGATARLLRPESPDLAVYHALRIETGGPDLVVPERTESTTPWVLRCDRTDPAAVAALWRRVRCRHAFELGRIEHPPFLSIESFPTTDVRIAVERLRRRRGLLAASAFASQPGFPTDARKAVATASVDLDSLAPEEPVVVTLKGLVPTVIAVALLHDENRNGRLDSMLGFPTEGFGFTGNPRVRFGPPKFDACRAALSPATPVRDLTLSIAYL